MRTIYVLVQIVLYIEVYENYICSCSNSFIWKSMRTIYVLVQIVLNRSLRTIYVLVQIVLYRSL